MKKTIKRPDGTEVTFEGTAEELAVLEREDKEQRDEGREEGNRRLLNEDRFLDMVRRTIADELARRSVWLQGPPAWIEPCNPAPINVPWITWQGPTIIKRPMPRIGQITWTTTSGMVVRDEA